MAGIPQIRIDGTVSGAGTVDTARVIEPGETLSFVDENPANVGATYAWSFRDTPEGASNTITDAATDSPTFVPDALPVSGTWYLECDADGFKQTILFATLTERLGLRKPAFNERLLWNAAANTKGWKLDVNQLFDAIEGSAPNYLVKRPSANQLNPTAGTAVALDEILQQNSVSSPSSIVDNGSNFENLKAGRLYLAIGSCRVEGGGTGFMSWKWRNVTAAALIGSEGFVDTMNTVTGVGGQSVAVAVVEPTVDTIINLEVRNNSIGTLDIGRFQSFGAVIEIPNVPGAAFSATLGALLKEGGNLADLATLPASPHPNDDEFNSDTLDPAYSLSGGSFGVSVPDIYDSGFTSGDVRRSVNVRKSWLQLQAPADSSFYTLAKDISPVPTNLLMYARLKYSQSNVAIANNDPTVGIELAADDSGGPSADDLLRVMISEPDAAAQQASFHKWDTAAFTEIYETPDSGLIPGGITHAALHKIGTTYHAWVAAGEGNWYYLGSTTLAATMVWFGIHFGGLSNVTPGPMIVGCDYLRFLETDKFDL